MDENTVRPILRLIGVVTMLVGVCLTTYFAILHYAALRILIQGGGFFQSEMFQSAAFYSLVADLTIIFWGYVFYVIAPAFARNIAR